MSNMPEFDRVYADAQLAEGIGHVPWNIGEPQPPIAALVDSGEVRDEVLDAGCGVGETSLYLAERGFQVVGADFSSIAISEARKAADSRGLTVEFQVADVTELPGFDSRFRTVIDSTLFHSLPIEARPEYVAAAARAAAPGAVLHALVFSREVSFPEGAGPNAVDEQELRDAFAAHWAVDSVRDARITAVLPEDGMDEVERDERGRGLLPAFLLRAHLPE